MVKDLMELCRPKLTAYELAEQITELACYDCVLEAHELVKQMEYKDLETMYTIGKIVEKYPQLWDKER